MSQADSRHHSDTVLLAGLNPDQRAAVLYLDGPCLVLAGAGSGKTRVITQKIAYLLRECAYQARNIFALTFTNKAAREMHERVRSLVNPRLLRGLSIGTFHALGLRFLREEHAAAGLKPGFSILDAADTLAIIQDLLATTDRARLRAVQQQISLWKNALLDPDQAALVAQGDDQVTAVRIFRSYQATLQAWQALDFDDLICLPARLLQADENIRSRWQARVHYLLVDEYQDTNTCQYQLVRLLCGDRAMFTAVGDNDQAIYAWRGATVENLARLGRDYPQLQLIKLEQNYRSVQSILQAANRVISHNPQSFEKSLWSELGPGETIQITPMDSDLLEAESVAMRLSAARFERRAEWRDFAVLYRGNHQARVLEQALRNLRIPYTVSGGQSFFDKAEIRDVLAWLRLMVNTDDDPAFIRAITTPRRGVGQATLQALGALAAEQGLSMFAAAAMATAAPDPSAILSMPADEDLLAPRQREAVHGFVSLLGRLQAQAERPGMAAQLLDGLPAAMQYEAWLYEQFDERPAQTRWSHVLELIEWLRRKADEDDLSLLGLVQHVSLVTMLDRADEPDPDAVRLSTLHAAKGLEFPHVFLVGVEEGLLPHKGGDDGDVSEAAVAARQSRIEEERRLMYVGITRAQRSLQISWCRKRRRGREDVMCEASRFISEMGLQAGAPTPAGDTDPGRTLARLKELLRKKPADPPP